MNLLSDGSLYKLEDKSVFFEIAMKAAFDGVEIIGGRKKFDEEVEQYRDLIEQTGLRIEVLHQPFHQNKNWGKDAVESLLKSIEFAAELKVGKLVVHTPLDFEQEYCEFLVENYTRLQQQNSIMICLENMPEWSYYLGPLGRWVSERYLSGKSRFRFYDTSRNVTALKRLFLKEQKVMEYKYNVPEFFMRFDHLTLDTTHIGASGIDLLDHYQKVKKNIRHIHLSDYLGKEHRFPFTGELPLKELLTLLKEDGYDGSISLEIDPAFIPSDDHGKVVRLFREYLECVRKFVN